MNLLRSTTGLLFASLLAALGAPAGADQVFSTVSSGPVHVYPTPGPYPLGDIYYSPCGGYGNYGGNGFGHVGNGFGHGGNGFGQGGFGRGMRGSTTLTGERFYPYDISSNGNRIGGHGRGNGLYGNNGRFGYGNCSGNNMRPSPGPGIPIPAPYATRHP
jgi:hypothetical protein